MYFLVLGLDPCKLVHDLIAPLVHALVAYVHLRVQDPQETEAFLWQSLHWYVHYLRIRHGRVVQVERVIRKHETRVIPLGSFDSPGWVYLNYFEMSQLVNNVLQIEEPQIAIYKSIRLQL